MSAIAVIATLSPLSPPLETPPPRLLDVLRQTARQHGHAPPMVETFARWLTRFVRFHDRRHPRELGVREVGRFLASVAATETAALRAIEEARNSLDFLYREVLHRDLGELPRPRPPRLLDQVRQVLRVRHYSIRTEECYVQWITRFLLFHGKRHPRDLGALEVQQFLTDLGARGRVSAST